jgi:two-component system response regulator HydG
VTVETLGPSELLIADSDDQTRQASGQPASELNLTVRTAQDSDEVLDVLESGLVDVLILNEQFTGGEQDTEFLRHIHYWYPETQVILVSNSPSFSAAVQSIKLGAFDYLPKPLEALNLRNTIERAMQQSRLESGRRTGREPGVAKAPYGIVGESVVMKKLHALIGKVAANIHPVLILGESGTGKELVARAIHTSGPRRDRPFIPVDCGTLVPTLMESELFGHERGAFTGAERAKDGLLKTAEGGTVFFDEIGELPVELQAKLLRALQEKEIRRVGSTKRIRIDVRAIAATNRDMEVEIHAGRFRKDLYFRLNVVTIKLTPLRERIEDVKHLIDFFLDRISKATGQPARKVSPEAMRMLQTYSWPGNVRELENFMERAVALGTGQTLEPVDFPTQLSARFRAGIEDEPLRRSRRVVPIAEVERHAILNAMAEAKGDKLLAAKMLGIGKTTLYRRLQQYEAARSEISREKRSPPSTTA